MVNRESLNERSAAVIRSGFALASNLGHDIAGSEHFLVGLCDEPRDPATQVLLNSGFDKELIKELIEKHVKDAKRSSGGFAISMTAEADSVMDKSLEIAKQRGYQTIEPTHILLAILEIRQSAGYKLIEFSGADPEEIKAELIDRLADSTAANLPETVSPGEARSEILEEFSRDVTLAAFKGELDPVIGRDREINRAIQILSRRKKNNPMLLGEPGVGKTAIVEGLAQDIIKGNVPENLKEKKIYSLDLNKMISGTKYRGEFEERMNNFLEELEKNEKVILFIDEIHTLIGAGASEGAMDAANTFKPALTTGKIQVIGATTFTEFKKHFEKDAALERRFQPVNIDEPSKEDAIKILEGLRERYEQYHELIIKEEAIDAAVELSERYIGDRFLPDKAIDLIDEAAARVKTSVMTMPAHLKEQEEEISKLNEDKQEAVEAQEYEKAAAIRDTQNELKKIMAEKQKTWLLEQSNVVNAQDIAGVVSEWTNIPVTMLTEDESKRLLGLEDNLHVRMVGQDDAVRAVSKAIRRNRVGIKSPNRPIGTFLFLGPTGVGKTELSKSLAEEMFNDEKAMIRIDMSEYMEKHTVAKLIGSPPGYVGYDEGGQLTEKVRHKPYSIVLFDEIEKAHPDVWNILLQIMDDGILTDGQGRTVSFKNTVIIMTSNVGARDITGKTSLGFSATKNEDVKPFEEIKTMVMEQVKKTFRPEFLNRIDDISVFHQLDRDNIIEIAGRMIEDLKKRSATAGIKIDVDDKAVRLLAEKGFDPKYGARPLKRMIQSTIEDMVAEKILEGGYEDGDKMLFTIKEQEIKVSIKKNKISKTAQAAVTA